MRRAYLVGWNCEQTVVPINRKRREKSISLFDRGLFRGAGIRVGLLVFHKVTSGLLVNMDVDEDY